MQRLEMTTLISRKNLLPLLVGALSSLTLFSSCGKKVSSTSLSTGGALKENTAKTNKGNTSSNVPLADINDNCSAKLQLPEDGKDGMTWINKTGFTPINSDSKMVVVLKSAQVLVESPIVVANAGGKVSKLGVLYSYSNTDGTTEKVSESSLTKSLLCPGTDDSIVPGLYNYAFPTKIMLQNMETPEHVFVDKVENTSELNDKITIVPSDANDNINKCISLGTNVCRNTNIYANDDFTRVIVVKQKDLLDSGRKLITVSEYGRVSGEVTPPTQPTDPNQNQEQNQVNKKQVEKKQSEKKVKPAPTQKEVNKKQVSRKAKRAARKKGKERPAPVQTQIGRAHV